MVDCSRPYNLLVNNYVEEVSQTFSNKGFDNLIDQIITYDYIAIVDIKDAYRAVSMDLECLAGRLAYCSMVVKGGRSFCSRIYDSIRALKKPYYLFRVNNTFREEIAWWVNFVDKFSGKARMTRSMRSGIF